MMNPEALTMDDVTHIFFEHTNPGSRLADLGRQRLASELDQAQEGVQHEYVLVGNGLGVLDEDEENVIVVEDSQDVGVPIGELPESSGAHDHLTTRSGPMYIPVVYRDRNLNNSFLV
jgi:hypothetical protein